METSFPLIKPELTRVHQLTSLENAVTEFEQFLKQHVSLVILGKFENSDLLIKNAHKLCTQQGAHPKQRILWIQTPEQIAALRSTIEALIEALIEEDESEQTTGLDNLRAIAFEPTTKKAAYFIYVDPKITGNPKDRRKRMSTFQMQKAFNAAIQIMPATEEEPIEATTPNVSQPTSPTDQPII